MLPANRRAAAVRAPSILITARLQFLAAAAALRAAPRRPRRYWAVISWVSGTVQTLLYADFVYLFVTKRNAQGHMILPS